MSDKSPLLIGAFESVRKTCMVVGTLLASGVHPAHVRLAISEADYNAKLRADADDLDYSHPTTVVRDHDVLNTMDPFNNELRDTPVTIEPSRNLRDLGPGQELLAYDTVQPDFPHDECEEKSLPPQALPRWGETFAALARNGTTHIPGQVVILGPVGNVPTNTFADFLVDQGLPVTEVAFFRRVIDEGGAILVVTAQNDAERLSLHELLVGFNPIRTSSIGYVS